MLFFGFAPEIGANVLYEACIERISIGETDALSTLYEHTKSAVFGFALSIVQNAQDAEDILQDTFISVNANAYSYKKLGKPLAWMLTITRNLSLMKLRQRKRTAGLSGDECGAFIADASALTSEDKLVLRAALKGIGSDESQIVMLHAVAGFKHRETAKLLDLPLSTVLSKYNRALKKLKAALEEGEFYDQ